MGYGTFSAFQQKIMQEATTLTLFVVFSRLFVGLVFETRYMVSFGLIFAAVVVAFSR